MNKIRFGYHVTPGASHITATAREAKELKMTALQAFAGGRINRKVTFPADPDACAEEMQGIYGLVHAAYVLNPCASPDSELAQVSVQCLVQTMEWAEACGFSAVVVHPGSAKDGVPETARSWGATNVKTVLEKYSGHVHLLLENSAGDLRGRLVGQRLEELEEITQALDDDRLGICVDTVHAWAAGYSLEEIVGLPASHPKIEAWHLNNPKPEVECGGHKDRHGTWNLGRWDRETFLHLLTVLRDKPMIMETRTGLEDLLLARTLLK
jgi:deoxyribonuclease-4